MEFESALISEQETETFAAKVAKICSGIESAIHIHLIGDLGAGKTTFCRGFIQSLGYSGRVKSPTYTLVEPSSVNGRQVFHFDLYRLADPEELEFIGIRDYSSGNSISLIEWPSKGTGLLPDPNLEISIEFTEQGRNIMVKGLNAIGDLVIRQLKEK